LLNMPGSNGGPFYPGNPFWWAGVRLRIVGLTSFLVSHLKRTREFAGANLPGPRARLKTATG